MYNYNPPTIDIIYPKMKQSEPRIHQSQYYPPNMAGSSSLQQVTKDHQLQFEGLQAQIKKDERIIKQVKNVFVGTGFTFDLTQFFKFQKINQLEPGGTFGSIFYEISGNGLSWVLLLYSVFNASFITVWILSSKMNKFLALTWRFMFQSLLMIPFVLYQKRTISFENSHKYTLKHIFNTKHLKKLYLSSIAAVLWYALILTAGEWTYMSHALYLGSLANFFLSLARHRNGYVHQYQLGGQVTVLLGIFFLYLDTYYFRYNQISPQQMAHKNNFYLSRSPGQRMLADTVALITSLIVSRFSSITTGIYHIFPPYLCMLVLDTMNAINMLLISYYFNGITFDSSSHWGLFSVFGDYQFAMFMYGCTVLCVGLVLSYMFVARMFPNFVAPTTAYFFEPGISTLMLNVAKVQALPRSFSFIGYTIMTPGMALIIVGQWLFLRNIKREKLLKNLQYIQMKELHDNLSMSSKQMSYTEAAQMYET